MNMQDVMKEESRKKIERSSVLKERAIEILDIVVAEWDSDPMSVQCFDLRIVQEAKDLVKEFKTISRVI